jgi:1,4-dihydroxy-6-naphthoate synthase
MTSSLLSLAFSPCPNDTFIFGALVNGRISNTGFQLANVVLEDVETLNRSALEGMFDITKLSFHAYGHVSDKYLMLSAGSALGRGCGPLLVTKDDPCCTNRYKKIAIPGQYTTAAMLLKLYLPTVETVEMRFDEIMPSIVRGDVDGGVIIHESRFTYHQHGLTKVVDLGEWWEKFSGGPIPLGGIAIKRSLVSKFYEKADNAIRSSILWAQQNSNECLPYIKKHSQELSDKVVKDHIALYVNEYSLDIGDEGRQAVIKFLEEGCRANFFSCDLERVFI